MSDEGRTFIRHMLETMAMPQRDDLIEEMKRTDALLEYAVVHGLNEEAERLREKLRALASMGDVRECKPVWNGVD